MKFCRISEIEPVPVDARFILSEALAALGSILSLQHLVLEAVYADAGPCLEDLRKRYKQRQGGPLPIVYNGMNDSGDEHSDGAKTSSSSTSDILPVRRTQPCLCT